MREDRYKRIGVGWEGIYREKGRKFMGIGLGVGRVEEVKGDVESYEKK